LPAKLDLKPRILYEVAKAAWDGKLYERREEICKLIEEEFRDKVTRRQVANQIRIAMGLNPHDDDSVISDTDTEALMGLGSEPIIVANAAACRNCSPEERACEQACPFGAISHDKTGRLTIDYSKCLEEGYCIDACSFDALAEKSQFVPLINLLKQQTHHVYASVAPAFAGQFGPDVTPGKLRAALLKLGFTDMTETALYADLVTMKEAFEFDSHVKTAADFLLTSCCCPVWIKLIENKYPQLIDHISPSVSPMIASARVIKALEPEAKVVFIGPCVAKKSEAQLPDLAGAVDFVLTFQELRTIFAAVGINPAEEPDIESSQASSGGRLYARTGGVSTAVKTMVERIIPHTAQRLTPIAVDGIPDCQKILDQLSKGEVTANFIEGMACKGGCVGGPGRLIIPAKGTEEVNKYSVAAPVETPVDNPNIYAILTKLGNPQGIPELTGPGPMSVLLARDLQK